MTVTGPAPAVTDTLPAPPDAAPGRTGAVGG